MNNKITYYRLEELLEKLGRSKQKKTMMTDCSCSVAMDTDWELPWTQRTHCDQAKLHRDHLRGRESDKLMISTMEINLQLA